MANPRAIAEDRDPLGGGETHLRRELAGLLHAIVKLAREFDYRVKQSGQLASKMRFAAAQWIAILRDGAWIRHAMQANRQAEALSSGLRKLGFKLIVPVEANGVFIE